jgi:sugar phosphate isomerase/epimerase
MMMRRYAMITMTVLLGTGLLGQVALSPAAAAPPKDLETYEIGELDTSGADALGWKLALQCWTCRQLTFTQTAALAKRLGIKYLEVYGGQRLGGDHKGKISHGMSPKEITYVKKVCKDNGVKIIACGVYRTPDDEAGARKVFDWLKALGIKTLNTEPGNPKKAMPMLEKLAKEYGITVGIHNHPPKSRYWDPKTVADATKGLKLVGFCADTGHWTRANLDAVEILKTYPGRIKSLHLKDLNEKGKRGARDIPWGTGICNLPAVLAELKAMGFTGPISMEYEAHWDAKTLGDNVKFFHKTANALAKADPKATKKKACCGKCDKGKVKAAKPKTTPAKK